MKKLILLVGFLITGLFSVQAQEIADHALGLRFSHYSGFGGAEFSYQKKLSGSTRLEADLGLRANNDYSFFKATGLYEWVNPLEDNFNWYLGAGGGLGSGSNTDLFIFAAGIIGIEYNFDFPLLLSLDFRPELNLLNGGGFGSDFGLSARYQF